MRRTVRYAVVIVGLWPLGGVGTAGAEEPAELDYALPGGGIEVHLPTPPEQKLRGADIAVGSWSPRESPEGVEAQGWVPGAPSQIPAARSHTTAPKSWSPDQPPAVPVRSWQPGQRSRIVVHGAY